MFKCYLLPLTEWQNPSYPMPNCCVCWDSRALRWPQLLFLFNAKTTNRAKFFLYLCTNPKRPEIPFQSLAIHKGGRGRRKAPSWSPSYLSDRWIVHCPFTVSDASQRIPCGILSPRLQTVSSLSNYSWNQVFLRNPWSRITVLRHLINKEVQSTYILRRA